MSLFDNKPAIEYLYESVPGIHDNIQARRASLVGLEVIQMILSSMKRIIDRIILNQCSGKEWLLSETIVDLLWTYTYCSDNDSNEYLSKHLDTMVK